MSVFPATVRDDLAQIVFQFLEDRLFQPGDLKATFATTAPKGWVMLTGQTINNIELEYPSLAKALGVAGNVTFPDCRGRGVIGAGAGAGLTNRVIRTTGGEETHLLTGPESGIQQHNHPWDDAGFGIGANNESNPAGATGHYVRTGGGTLVGNAGPTNAQNPHNVMQPWVAANIMMKL